MEKLSANSKRGQRYINTYNRSTRHTLKDAYAKPSAAKQAAFKRCLQQYDMENGHNLRIISASPWFFTVAFEVTTALGATGLRVITREHDYLIIFGDKL